MQDFSQALGELLPIEGGLVDNPADPGGRTNLGVTQASLTAARAQHPELGLPATVEELTRLNVGPFYRVMFWSPLQCDRLPYSVASVLFKHAVNVGVEGATRILQSALGLVVDGVFGPRTIQAVNDHHARDVVVGFLSHAMTYYTRLPGWAMFGNGWAARLVTEALESGA